MRRNALALSVVVAGMLSFTGTAFGDARLSNDAPGTGGYVSDYTLVTGRPVHRRGADRVQPRPRPPERAGRGDGPAQRAT